MFPATPGKQQQKRSLPPPPAGFVLSRRLPPKMSQRKSARSAGDSYRSFVETIGNIVARYYLNSSLSRSLRQRPITFPRLPLRNFIIIPGSTLEFTGAIITGNMIRRAKSQSRSTCLRGLGHNPNSTRPVWSEESGALGDYCLPRRFPRSGKSGSQSFSSFILLNYQCASAPARSQPT